MAQTVPVPQGAQLADDSTALPASVPGQSVAVPQGAELSEDPTAQDDTSQTPDEPGIADKAWTAAKSGYNDIGEVFQNTHDFISRLAGYHPSQNAKDELFRGWQALKDGGVTEAADHLRASAQDIIDNHPAEQLLKSQWDSSARNLAAVKEDMKAGDHIAAVQHAAGIMPIANVVSDAYDKAIAQPTIENITHATIAGILALSPAIIKGASATRGAEGAEAAESAPAAEDAAPALDPKEARVQASVKKIGLEPGEEGRPATTVKIPARKIVTPGTEPESPPTGTMHEPVLQNSVRNHVNETLQEAGLKPLDDTVDLRDLGDRASKQFYTRAQQGFADIRNTTGKNLSTIDQQLRDLYRQKADVFDDPDKEGAVIEKINRLESEADRIFKEAKDAGVDVDKPMQDWKQSKALANWGEQVRRSVDPLAKSGTFDPSKYTPRLEKVYRSDPRFPGTFDEASGVLNEAPTQLEQAFGKSRAEAMRDDAYAASDTQKALKDFKPRPGISPTKTTIPAMEAKTAATSPTESKALYNLVRENTGRRFMVGDQTTNWGKVYKSFDKLTPAERASMFKDPATVEKVILKQARQQVIRRVGGGALTALAVGHVLGVDGYIAGKILLGAQ